MDKTSQGSVFKHETLDPCILDSINSIQPPSIVVTRLIDLLQREYHADEVIKTLLTDPVLTAALLKKCNTAFFSQRARVTSLNQAIQLLGSSTILTMVLELTLGASMNTGLSSYGIPPSGLRKHSLCTAVAAKELIKYCVILPFTMDTAFTAGLLHDLGKIVLNDVLSIKGLSLAEHNEASERSNTELERDLTGTDHAEIASMVLAYWKFPDFFCEAVGQHHSPSGISQLSHLIHIANWCAYSTGLGFGYPSVVDDLSVESLSALALTAKEVEEAISDTHTAINKQFKSIFSQDHNNKA